MELVKSPIDPLSISFIYIAKLYFSRDKQIKVMALPLFLTLNFVYGARLEVGIFEYFIIGRNQDGEINLLVMTKRHKRAIKASKPL